ATARGSDTHQLDSNSMNPKDARPLIITRVCEQSREIRSFDLMPETARDKHGVEFRPGQIAVLHVDEEEPAYFAFASAPEDRELQILVKRTVGASIKLFDMHEDDEVELINVAGDG